MNKYHKKGQFLNVEIKAEKKGKIWAEFWLVICMKREMRGKLPFNNILDNIQFYL